MCIEEFYDKFKESWNDSNIFRIDNIILVKLDKFYQYNIDKKEWNDDSYKELENIYQLLIFAQPRNQVIKGTYLGTLANAYYVGNMQICDLALLFPEYNYIMEQAIKLHVPFVLNAFRQDHRCVKNINSTSLLKAMEMSTKQLNQFQNYIYMKKNSFFYYLERMGLFVNSFKGIQDDLFGKLIEISFNDNVSNNDLEFYRDNILSKPLNLQIKINKIQEYIENNFSEYRMLRDSLKRLNRLDEHIYPQLPPGKLLKDLIPNLQSDLIKYQNEELYNTLNEAYKSIYPKLTEFEYAESDYIIKAPKKIEELDIEGNQLHHCVGSYKEVVSNGKEIVLFLRKKDTPDESYYTIDLDNEGFIRQIHSKYNGNLQSDPDCKKLIEFLTSWAQKKSDIINIKSLHCSYGAVCHL